MPNVSTAFVFKEASPDNLLIDLSSVFAMLAEEEELNRTLISKGLGHTKLEMTDRYLQRGGEVPPQAVIRILDGIS